MSEERKKNFKSTTIWRIWGHYRSSPRKRLRSSLFWVSDDEDNQSIYSAYEEESSSKSEVTSEEDEEYTREVYILKVKYWEENMAEEMISSYRVNSESFVCDYCQCYETNGLPMFCEEIRFTYHKKYFIAEARRKTKTGSISQSVE